MDTSSSCEFDGFFLSFFFLWWDEKKILNSSDFKETVGKFLSESHAVVLIVFVIAADSSVPIYL